jgi:hypothetical protein
MGLFTPDPQPFSQPGERVNRWKTFWFTDEELVLKGTIRTKVYFLFRYEPLFDTRVLDFAARR